jgi:hypothetical protein
MKAYKQINYRFENRIVFGYAGLMSLLCSLILLSPVIAQDTIDHNRNQPKVHYDINKEYDKDGNLTNYDSTYSWYWSGDGSLWQNYDSLFKQFHRQFDILDENWNWSGIIPFYDLKDQNHFRYCDKLDSIDFQTGDSSLQHFFYSSPGLGLFPFYNDLGHFSDSLDMSFFHFDDLSKLFDHQLDIDRLLKDDNTLRELMEQQDEFIERFREYQNEHQKLIEKYFYQPEQDKDKSPQNQPQKFQTPPSPSGNSRSGRI